MSLTKVSYSMINSAPVSVIDYGADASGTTDSTSAIQAAINTGLSVFFPKGTYRITSLSIASRSNVSYFGYNDVTITNVGATTPSDGLVVLSGTISQIEFSGLKFVGDGTINAYNYGISCASGQTISQVTFRDLHFYNVRLGLGLNADTGGTFANSVVDSCVFDTMVGETAGNGYGIICPNAFGTIITDCTFINVGRHDVYVGRGGYVTVANCYFKDHRKSTYTGNPRAAVQISRNVQYVVVTGCIFTNFYDGAVQIAHATGEAGDCKNITVSNCMFDGPLNVVPAIYLGEQAEPTTQFTRNITIVNNQFNGSELYEGPFISATNGNQIIIKDNQFTLTDITANTSIISLGSASYSANANSCNKLTVVDNQFNLVGTAGTVTLVALNGYVGANVDTSVWIDTKFYKYSTGITVLVWNSPVSGYANIGVQGAVGRSTRSAIVYINSIPTTGTWNVGDIAYNIAPASAGYIGWVCTTSGTPGTWKTFGLIS